jgi:hypothetical protein
MAITTRFNRGGADMSIDKIQKKDVFSEPRRSVFDMKKKDVFNMPKPKSVIKSGAPGSMPMMDAMKMPKMDAMKMPVMDAMKMEPTISRRREEGGASSSYFTPSDSADLSPESSIAQLVAEPQDLNFAEYELNINRF